MIRILFFSTLFIGNILLAQTPTLSTTNKKAIFAYREAERNIPVGNFSYALELLQEATKKDKKFIEPHIKIAEIYLRLREYDKAKQSYDEAEKRIPKDKTNHYPSVFIAIADLNYKEGKYEVSLDYFNKVKPVRLQLRKVLVNDIDRKIRNCKFAIAAKNNALPFNPEILPKTINKYQNQCFPFLTADKSTLIFTGRKGLGYKDDEDIYISEYIDNTWTDPISISQNINTPLNEGSASISANGRNLVFTSCGKKGGLGSCDLYISKKEGGNWSKPINIGAPVNSKYWESHPSMSADGRVLFFASNRPGTLGKYDVWVSFLNDDGTWTKPKNPGTKINTPYEDMFPFIHPNGKTLYFSSRGHVGMGGHDIFYTELNDTGWTQPKNMGYPINSHKDETSIFITSDYKQGFFALEDNYEDYKNRKYLLYKFDFPEELKSKTKTVYAKGFVYDKETKKPLKASIEVRPLNKNRASQISTSDSVNGEFLVTLNIGNRYGLYAKKEGYLFYNNSLEFKGINDSQDQLNIYLEKAHKGAKISLNNIFFESGKYTLKQESITELEVVKEFILTNPELNMLLAGHTGNVGSKEANLKLSKNRAKAVFDYLIDQGVPQKNLKFEGFADSQPLVPNDTESNKALNRRIEFIVK